MRIYLLTLTFFFLGLSISAQSIKVYKLSNGLTVILDSNESDTHISGRVVVNVGSADEDVNATGVAHYLEHMLFKGTEELGTVNWDAEKAHYNNIIKLYDELQNADSEEQVIEINEKINEESQKEAKYIVTNELSAAVQQMGGVGLNANTTTDRTLYFNTIPTNQLEKWLELYSHRFKHPVFRLFQTELETVYEEKNRSSDNLFLPYYYKTQEIIFGDNDPYARPVIGKTEHLKKPWLSAMIDFYNTWYVPNNMALILSGNFNIEATVPLIEEYFGALESKELPKRPYENVVIPLKPREENIRLTPYLVASKSYLIPKTINLREAMALDVISELLNNRSQTGLLDELRIDGDVISANASFRQQKRVNQFNIEYTPRFDINQRRQESFSFAGGMVDDAVEEIKNGKYDDMFLENIKSGMYQNWESMMSSQSNRTSVYSELFYLGIRISYVGKYDRILKSINKKYLREVFEKYLNENYISIRSEKGEARKEKKIEKPKLDPIVSVTGDNSDYLKNFVKMPVGSAEFTPFDVSNIKISQFGNKINLHYLKNDNNNIFRLIIKFHAGERKYPLVKYSVSLLNNAGVLGQYESTELRKEFGKLNVTYSFFSDDDATYVVLQGYDDKLDEAGQLLSRLVLMPEIKEKSMNGIIGRELSQRSIETKSIDIEKDALREYLIYGDESKYLDRLSSDELITLSPSELSLTFHKVTGYEADIHYFGNLSEDSVNKVLKNNLAFSSQRQEGVKPKQKDRKVYSKNTILLVNESKAAQAHIYLYLNLEDIALEDIVRVKAFNQYFSGSFNGLITKEIRENRALAYTSGAYVSIPLMRDWDSQMIGYVGTQSDKTAEVVEVLLSLLNEFPEYPERMDGIVDYLKNSSEIESETKAGYSLNYEQWKQMGYVGNPVLYEQQFVDNLEFDDVKEVFTKLIKDKKISIAILGRTKDMDIDKLESLGEIVKVRKKNMFSRD